MCSKLYWLNQILSLYKQNITVNYKTFNFGKTSINLDNEQHEIVISNPNNHIRIIAGAGSGKTTTILCKSKYLVDNYVFRIRS